MQYSIEYLKYRSIQSPSNPHQRFCLICEKAFANEVMKPSKLVKQLKNIASDSAGKGLSYFQSLRGKFQKRSKLSGSFWSASRQNNYGLRIAYNPSLLTAKCGKPLGSHMLSVKDCYFPAVSEELRTAMRVLATEIMQKIPLNNNTSSHYNWTNRSCRRMKHNCLLAFTLSRKESKTWFFLTGPYVFMLYKRSIYHLYKGTISMFCM
ncbi:hypothetical protein M513_07915, partial [Trichuris suis]